MLNRMKKMRNKKGFTLIELIVVIAILAILAAIAVPRMAGFTDKAKQSADTEYGSIIARSVQTMIAAGDITNTSGDDVILTVSAAGAVTEVEGTSVADAAGLATFNTELIKLNPVKVLKFYTANGMTVTIDGTSNEITVAPAAAPAA